MRDGRIKSLIKYVGWGIVWGIVLTGVGLIISNNTKYGLSDVLFVEGMVLAIVGICASMGGDSFWGSMFALGQSNAQYFSTTQMELSKLAKERSNYSLKNTLMFSVNSFSLIIGGAIAIMINFFI